jgi:hypothetical protein
LALSGQSEFYEASDWSTAVVAAQIYDMFLRTRHANLLPSFLRLTERLGVTVIDRKRNRIELSDAEVSDTDEEAADEAVIAWHGRLGIVKDVEGELWPDSTQLRSGDSTAAGCWVVFSRGLSGQAGARLAWALRLRRVSPGRLLAQGASRSRKSARLLTKLPVLREFRIKL